MRIKRIITYFDDDHYHAGGYHQDVGVMQVEVVLKQDDEDDLAHVVLAYQHYDDVAISEVHKAVEVFPVTHGVVLQIIHQYVGDARPKQSKIKDFYYLQIIFKI